MPSVLLTPADTPQEPDRWRPLRGSRDQHCQHCAHQAVVRPQVSARVLSWLTRPAARPRTAASATRSRSAPRSVRHGAGTPSCCGPCAGASSRCSTSDGSGSWRRRARRGARRWRARRASGSRRLSRQSCTTRWRPTTRGARSASSTTTTTSRRSPSPRSS